MLYGNNFWISEINLKRISKILAMRLGLLLAILFASSMATAQEDRVPYRVAFVNSQRIYQEAAPYQAAGAKILGEFAKRKQELTDLAARFQVMSEKLDREAPALQDSDRLKRQRELADLDREYQRKLREFNEDISQRNNEETAVLAERTKKIIKQIAETEGFDIVLLDAYYWSPRADITDKVLQALSK